jgi:F-box/leucine-rich repeat protein 10/11
MATSRSFIYTSAAPPPRYRTPSPPRDAYEPLSPHASHADWPHNGTTNPAEFRLFYGDSQTFNGVKDYLNQDNIGSEAPGDRKSRAGTAKHSRSGSTIETLATIALAASPTFASPPLHSSFANLLPQEVQGFADHGSIGRPSKRARSEKAPSPILHRTSERPATSHIKSPEVPREDLDLFMNFIDANAKPKQLNQELPHASPVEIKWNEQSNDLPGALGPVNTGSVSAGLALQRADESNQVDVQNHTETTSPMETNTSEQHLPQLSNVDILQKKIPLPEPSFIEGIHKDTEVEEIKSETQNTGDTDAQESLAELSTESEAHDMATATCAACDSAWIDENGADPAGATSWIRCDGCKRWFHLSCTEIKDEEEMRNIDKFSCKDCEATHGPTTYVRKSSRTRIAIDYAGLNQGVIKASVDGPAHHYIQPIKEGTLKFKPESFPRMRAELVTAEYFEKGSGMTEPIVIPASMNTGPTTADMGDMESNLGYSYDDDSSVEYSWTDDSEDEEEEEEVVDCEQDGLDMVIPKGLTVRMVADLYGPDEKVEVIDVKSQQGEDKRWNMRKWADYYESEGNTKVIRNVISLEVSQSKLGRLIRRPRIVRELDLQDSVWPENLKATSEFPKVQFYCLMSPEDCFTDFHIDFGGSSVFYHILRGRKTFFFIPPKEKHLKKYEEWCNSKDQDTVFLGDVTKECYRVDLSAGDTMLIPAGWIHAVWTPENSLVIGGNFLTRMHYGMQIKVAKIEKDTKVARKFRYPYFQKILWYAAIKYIEDDPIPTHIAEAFHKDENYRFYRKFPSHYEFGERANTEEPGSDMFNVRYYSQPELDGLPDLAKYLLRTALIAQELLMEGITQETRRAVKRSIPKGHGEPLDIVKTFGIWLAWKRGNERAANWTHPDMYPSSVKADAKWTRQPEKNAGKKPILDNSSNGNRQSSRKQSTVAQPVADANGEISDQPIPDATSPSTVRPAFPTTPKSSGLGPRRIACDACRKRRIRCRHKDESSETKKKGYAVRMEMNTKQGSSGGSKADSVREDATTTPTISRDFTQIDSNLSVNGPSLFSKKGRSKACDECRKSKVSSPLHLRLQMADDGSDVAFTTNLEESILSKLKSHQSQGQQELLSDLERAMKEWLSRRPKSRSRS